MRSRDIFGSYYRHAEEVGSGNHVTKSKSKQTHVLFCVIFPLFYKQRGLTTLNKPKSRQVYTNDGIITQNIFNAAVSTSVELKTNTKKLHLCEYLISTRCLLHPGYQI